MRKLFVYGKKHAVLFLLLILLLCATGLAVYQIIYQGVARTITTKEGVKQVKNVEYDSKITNAEKELIAKAVELQDARLPNGSKVTVTHSIAPKNIDHSVAAFVPVTAFGSVVQKVSTSELVAGGLTVANTVSADDRAGIAASLGVDSTLVAEYSGSLDDIPSEKVVFIPVDQLTQTQKLLSLDELYYLDTFSSGAVFREIVITLESSEAFDTIFALSTLPKKDSTLKMNVTGVTALTRVMMKRLATVKDPLYFSEKIAAFLADADITHVSNEVSFKDNCTYSNTLFCSPPNFIEVLKASGVDVVELTGNHNNDFGANYNTATINQYREIGWSTVGGGLNAEDAKKPYVADQKGSKVTMLAYNFPDSPSGSAIAGKDKAGANGYNLDRIAQEITQAKTASNFVMVHVQYWECYAYPDGYVEYPKCDVPIGKQEADFKKLIDLGADMVVGTSAHQPQTYELSNGKPIYYGLGNLYFEQTDWPGTERSIILTNYFVGGKLIQTKLTPTVFDEKLQTRLSTDTEAAYLLQRLKDAR
jgi:poly-gamma-glutamate capsule biosynthesis protein CapA/YwtB (metallophosphatase superfamily)